MNNAGTAQTTDISSVIVEVGKTPIVFRTADPAFRKVLEKRYAGFLNPDASSRFQFDIELFDAERQVDSGRGLRVSFHHGRWRIERDDFLAEWNPGDGRGTIRQSSNPYSADAVLRIVHSLILAEEGGFLLHASSAAKNGKAFLFTGVSGAGKTTISQLAPSGVTLLTDEISYVRPEGSGYRAYGTPFSGSLGKPGKNLAAPVSTLFFLEKGPRNLIEPIAFDDAMRRVLRNILFFAEDARLVNLVFQSACDFIQNVSSLRLIFVPDERVWEIIS